MKKTFQIITISVALIAFLHMQSTARNMLSTSVKDTTIHKEADSSADRANIGPVTLIVKHQGKPVFRDSSRRHIQISWFQIDLGFNNYVDRSLYGTAEVNNFAPASSGQPEATKNEFTLRNGKSVNVNIWPVMFKFNLVSHHLNFITGIGVEMNNYRYSRNITYVNSFSRTNVIWDSVNFSKNKLFTEYLTIPVLLNLNTNPSDPDRSFRFSAGPTFGYLIKSRTKQISSERGKVKNNSDFNLEDYRIGLRASIGYKWVQLYGSYSLTPIHQYGLKQYPFSIGIALGTFN